MHQHHEYSRYLAVRVRPCAFGPVITSGTIAKHNIKPNTTYLGQALLYLVRGRGRGPDKDGLGVVGVDVHGRPQQVQPGGLRDHFLFRSFWYFHREVRGVSVVPEQRAGSRERSGECVWEHMLREKGCLSHGFELSWLPQPAHRVRGFLLAWMYAMLFGIRPSTAEHRKG